MNLQKATLHIEFVDESTGELTVQDMDVIGALAKAIATKSKTSKSSSAKSKLIEDTHPTLVLEDTKYCLTTGAIDMLGVTPGEDTLEIEYQKIGMIEYPLIGVPQAYGNASGGNKLTKTGTVRFGGAKHDRLAEYGTTFTLVKHPNADNLFILTQDGNTPEGDASLESLKADKKKNPPKKSLNIVPEKEVPQPEAEDISDVNDLQQLLDDEDNKEFNMSDFTL